MGELTVFLLLLAGVAIYDIRAIKKSGLKNVLGMYVFLTALTSALAVWFMSKPDRLSILGHIMRIMRIES
jgi:uncharacterized membrane-anchored protein